MARHLAEQGEAVIADVAGEDGAEAPKRKSTAVYRVLSMYV